MAWEISRLQAIEPMTIYKLRSSVMFGDLDPPIPHYFRDRQIA